MNRKAITKRRLNPKVDEPTCLVCIALFSGLLQQLSNATTSVYYNVVNIVRYVEFSLLTPKIKTRHNYQAT